MVRIFLDEYDPAWPGQFNTVRERLFSALGQEALAVEHVGSTSVPGLCAKPVIDAVLVVPDSANETTYLATLIGAGFHFDHREPDWHEHRLFKLDSPRANIHVFSAGCPEIERMVRFRDKLQYDARARDAYAATKRALALRDWPRVQAYADAKSEVVTTLLEGSESDA